MLNDKSIAIVVPAYNEEKLIARVLDTLPHFVDYVVVVDDCSQDQTSARVLACSDSIPRPCETILERHEQNRGVGAAIVTGYRRAVDWGADVVAVMAGDAQMDPSDLEKVLRPVIEGKADYVKGNRLFTGEAWKLIPHHRYLGNAFLSLVTKIASGYWQVADSQTGYTAISADVLGALPLDQLYPRYGYPNHLLVMLNVHDMRVVDVPVSPVYNIGEQSGIRLWKVIPTLSWLLFKLFLWRMVQKYVIRDFHPLVFFYLFAFGLFLLDIPLTVRFFIMWFAEGLVPRTNLLALMFATITGLQSLFFAMWFDMEYNRGRR